MGERGGGASSWPYPRWIGHRGAGTLAPENTLAAFRLGASYGFRMFECDVKLSSDGVPFLMHDWMLERTTSGRGPAGEQPWSALQRLDAGAWHSQRFAGEGLPSLEAVANWCLAGGLMLNLEIKPGPGMDERTGEVVAAQAAALWKDAPVPPLLTSFQPQALEAARRAAPHLPRGLLMGQHWDGWDAAARQLGCVAIVCNHTLWDAPRVAQCKAAGWRCLSYTVNDPAAAQRLITLGTDGIITDRVDLFKPD